MTTTFIFRIKYILILEYLRKNEYTGESRKNIGSSKRKEI